MTEKQFNELENAILTLVSNICTETWGHTYIQYLPNLFDELSKLRHQNVNSNNVVIEIVPETKLGIPECKVCEPQYKQYCPVAYMKVDETRCCFKKEYPMLFRCH